MYKRTKIVATIGPASEKKEIFKQLVDAGLSAARLNFSHGTHEEHGKRIAMIREVEKEHNTFIPIIQDLQGPKIRLGNIREEVMLLEKHEKVTLAFANEQTDEKLPVDYNIFPYLKEEDRIFINDGIIKLHVEKIYKTSADCIVVNGGEIRSHKGINLPDTKLPNISLTEKDEKDLAYGLTQDIDFVAISFIQDVEDILSVRKFMETHQQKPKIIVKIETAPAIKNLEAIIQATDGVMIARGDLAVEIGQEEVPIVQRRIIKLCKQYHKPVIVATQMLESMIKSPVPTRAEVNDVATAVMDQVDAVMLSAEAAIGEYPVEAVATMNRIILRVEKYNQSLQQSHVFSQTQDDMNQTQAIVESASILASQLHAKIIFVSTSSGKTALALSSCRPFVPIAAITQHKHVCTQLALVWGVLPFHVEKQTAGLSMYAPILTKLKVTGYVDIHDTIVTVTGTNAGTSGNTNIIHVTKIEEK